MEEGPSLGDEESLEGGDKVVMSLWNQTGSTKLVVVKSPSTYLHVEVVSKVDQVSGRVLVCRQFAVIKRSS